MIIVFTDDLICAMRARYGLAAAALPHGGFAELLGDGQQLAERAVLLLLVLDQVVDEVGLQDRVVGLEPDVGLGAAVLLGDLRQALARASASRGSVSVMTAAAYLRSEMRSFLMWSTYQSIASMYFL